jgi:hypothetical protein
MVDRTVDPALPRLLPIFAIEVTPNAKRFAAKVALRIVE